MKALGGFAIIARVSSVGYEMAEPVSLKYRAFISYSHADTKWAKWLHRALESFRIDKDLIGRKTGAGTIPKALRPIFRDRDDFSAGHSLTDQTLAALDASAGLVVICSPSAAMSHYVNEEVRLFKSRHPERPIVPLIVDGEHGEPERECFPRALRFAVDAKGEITNKAVELLAADAREEMAKASRSPRLSPVCSAFRQTISFAAPSATVARGSGTGSPVYQALPSCSPVSRSGPSSTAARPWRSAPRPSTISRSPKAVPTL